ncbi:hypothetical protein ACFL0V_03945 [Nanoarchaeota archaeon]
MPIIGLLSKKKKEHYAHLLTLEINSFLKKIYKSMKRSLPLKPPLFKTSQLKIIHSTSVSKSYEFKLNKKEQIKHGNIGNVICITNGLAHPMFRKQRALFIACEIYVYHAFANHPNPKYFNSIKSQNQYIDTIKHFFGGRSSHNLRDQAVRYVIEEIDEHKLAHMSGEFWHVNIAKVERHSHKLADLLGSSEKTFKSIIHKQHQKFNPTLLRSEEHLIRKEIEDIQFLIDFLETQRHGRKHIPKFRSYLKQLIPIKNNLHHWYIDDKDEHKLLTKGLISHSNVQQMLKAEAEADQIDINKVYILFQHFERDKVSVLKELDKSKT